MSDVDEITKVIERYIEGGIAGEASIMEPSFHDQATIYWVADGKTQGGPIQALYDLVEGKPAPNLTGAIGPIDVNASTATARVVLADWGGADYTDQFALLKTDGEWRIMTKVFHDHT